MSDDIFWTSTEHRRQKTAITKKSARVAPRWLRAALEEGSASLILASENIKLRERLKAVDTKQVWKQCLWPG